MTDCQHCALKRGRGRPPVHPLWFDVEAKVCRSHRQHPNGATCKNFLNNVKSPPDPESPYADQHGDADHFRIVDRWLDVATFTYEMTCDAGIRPDKWHIIWPKDPRKPVGPGNVVWLRRPRHGVREERRRQIQSLEAQEVLAELLSEADVHGLPDGSHLLGSVARRLKHMPSCESSWLDAIECPCAEFVRDYFSSY